MGERSLHTREVAGSNPAAPIRQAACDRRASRQPGGFEGSLRSMCIESPMILLVTERPDVEEAVRHFGIAASHAPAVANGGDDLSLVGMDHLLELDPESLEVSQYSRRRSLCDVEAAADSDGSRRDVRLVESKSGSNSSRRHIKTGQSPPRRPAARSPRSPATSPAQYPAGSGVGVSVLLRQPHGFEGLGAVR